LAPDTQAPWARHGGPYMSEIEQAQNYLNTKDKIEVPFIDYKSQAPESRKEYPARLPR